MKRIVFYCCIIVAGFGGLLAKVRAQQTDARSEFSSWLATVDENAMDEQTASSSIMPRHDVDATTVRQYVRDQQQSATIRKGFQPWWQQAVVSSFDLAAQSIEVQGETLILEALRHSHHIAAINEDVMIAQTGITRAAAEFDPTAFLDSKFIRTSVPTGSALDAGIGVSRLREEDFSVFGGLRRKTETGANLEFGQQMGLRDSNSLFFTPPNQGNTRLTVSFNQPLLSGGGRAYNRSLIVLAQLDTAVTKNAAMTAIQDHLIAVQDTFWELYFHRASLVLRIRHLEQAAKIADWLHHRQKFDALVSQVRRADAAVASRRSELSQAIAAIRNAEDRLRSLVNSPNFSFNRSVEIIPAQPPSCDPVPIALDDAVVTAMSTRSEITEVARELDAARVRLRMARNELLPILDVVLESYLSGLRGEHGVGQAWVDQFSVGEPSYTAGFRFEVPLQRRVAQANVNRRQAQIRQLSGRLQQTIAELHAEVAAAVRDVDAAYREVQSRYLSMQAADEYVALLDNRWKQLVGDAFSSTSMLEDLLDAQDRLVAEEVGFAKAQTEYATSMIKLKRSTGTLLQVD